MKPLIAFHTQHDANATVYLPETQTLRTFELAKIRGMKHYGFVDDYKSPDAKELVLKRFYNQLENLGIKPNFSLLITGQGINNFQNKYQSFHQCGFLTLLKETNYDSLLTLPATVRHHEQHAWSGYIQSPFKKAFVMAYDGGGEGAVSHCTYGMNNGVMEWAKPTSMKLSWAYVAVGRVLFDVILRTSRLDQAGKFMALTAYGNKILPEVWEACDYVSEYKRDMTIEGAKKFQEEWFEFGPGRYGGKYTIKDLGTENAKYFGVPEDSTESPKTGAKDFWKRLQNKYALKVQNWKKRSLQDKYDAAYTAQQWFNSTVIKLFKDEYLEKIKEYDNNVVLTGGSAMNIIVNSALKKEFPEINFYIPPNPGDEGLSLGIMAAYLLQNNIIKKQDKKLDLKFNDFPILDLHRHEGKTKTVIIPKIISMLKEGKIIGLMQGNLENGARALGNRSILCSAHIPGLKDKINKEVKLRESFRPFAPVCRKEDAPKWFEAPDFEGMDTMAYAVMVKPEYREELESVTHVDGSARLQTVTREDNKLLYSILTQFDGVLLNTSLNVKGQPIVNRIEGGNSAKRMLKSFRNNNEGLDAVIFVGEKGKLYILE